MGIRGWNPAGERRRRQVAAAGRRLRGAGTRSSAEAVEVLTAEYRNTNDIKVSEERRLAKVAAMLGKLVLLSGK